MEEMLSDLLVNDVARGLLLSGLMVVAAIPQALLGKLFRKLPEDVLPRKDIPKILALGGLALGWLLGAYTPIPMAEAFIVGVGSGWGSGTMSAHVKGAK